MQKKTKRILLFAGSAIMGTAYCPVPKPMPTKEFIARTYIRSNKQAMISASERRKQELQQRIIASRAQFRRLAETYYIDRNTKITGITANQKLIVHSTKLMNEIAKYKNA